MAFYLLLIAPNPVKDDDFHRVFAHLSYCNPAYNGYTWKGPLTYTRSFKFNGLWNSMLQMKDETVSADGQLMVVWSPDPLNERADPDGVLFHQHRDAILESVREWADAYGAQGGSGVPCGSEVAWLLTGANTALIAQDIADGWRKQLRIIRSDDHE